MKKWVSRKDNQNHYLTQRRKERKEAKKLIAVRLLS